MRKTVLYHIIFFISLFAFLSCSKDDDAGAEADFVVAFESPSVSFGPEDHSKEITLVFSRMASSDGSITLSYSTTGAVYGEDFTTMPEASSQTLIVPVTGGSTQTYFTFHKLQNPIEGETKEVSFEITTVGLPNGYTQGNSSTLVSFTETAALGGSINPEVGGPNQPNQVYVDLSSQQTTMRNRTSWDLGFYSGEQFRVAINGSVYMAAAALDATDIDTVTEADVMDLQPQVAIGTFDPSNMAYIDDPSGVIEGTAIQAVSEQAASNKVYLINLGYEVGTTTPNPGSVAVAGQHRGWKKIRVLRDGDSYVLQYADLNSSSHQSVTIPKDGNYNFTFFSFTTNSIVSVEPAKTNWDLNFTVFTNEIEGFGSYGYADFVASNRKGGVTGYMVDATAISYSNFTSANIQSGLFEQDQRFIGSKWRVGGGPGTLPSLAENVFFIVKDPDGNVYKLRFTALLNDDGIRGYPAFEYQLL